MPADESHDPVPEQGCIHHPGQQEKYLSIEQPWLKHCRLCALNLALCGRTI